MLSKKLKTSSITLLTIFIALSAATHVHAGKKKNNSPEVSESAEKTTKRLKVVSEELPYSADEIHAATLQAMAVIGCKVKKDESNFIQGKRPNKIGVAVGSGGEILKIDLKNIDENSTEITITTKKTMAGIVGQRLWSEELLETIKTVLSD